MAVTGMMRLLIAGGSVYAPGEVLDRGAVLMQDGKIIAVGREDTLSVPPATKVIRVDGQHIIPGLVDVHLHGYKGNDVGGPGLSSIIRDLPSHGVTAFLPTTIALNEDELIKTLSAMSDVMQVPPPGAQPLGIHMEGPWVAPSRAGGMRPEMCRPLTKTEFEHCQSAARGLVRMVTLAPEQGDTLSLIPWLVSQGVVVSIGHSDADYDLTLQAVEAGLTHSTHTFNAMRPFHQREPGALGVVLTNNKIVAQLIADGYHVHPAVMKILIQAKGPDYVCIVSDAVPMAGMPPGTYEWDGRTMIREGSTNRFPNGALAGSAMMADEMLRVLVDRVGIPFQKALQMASETPAALLGVKKGRLAVGYDADVVILGDNWKPTLTIIAGKPVYQA